MPTPAVDAETSTAGGSALAWQEASYVACAGKAWRDEATLGELFAVSVSEALRA